MIPKRNNDDSSIYEIFGQKKLFCLRIAFKSEKKVSFGNKTVLLSQKAKQMMLLTQTNISRGRRAASPSSNHSNSGLVCSQK